MSTQLFSVDIYQDGERTLYAEGDGFTVRFTNSVAPLDSKVENGKIRIEMNETSVVLVKPWDEDIEGELIREGVEIEVTLSNGDGFAVGKFDNTPGYSPYHGMTEDGQVYKVQRVIGELATDDLLEVDASDTDYVVENISTGISKPMDYDEVQQLFEEGKLTPVCKIR